MRRVIWFIAIALLYKRVRPLPHDLNASQFQELNKKDILTLQLVERPLGSKGDNWIFRIASALGFKHQGVLATLNDGRQFLVHKVRINTVQFSI